MRLSQRNRFINIFGNQKYRDWGPNPNNYGEGWEQKAASFNTNFASNKSGVGGVRDVLNPMVGENQWNQDPANFSPASVANYRLDGWNHRVDLGGKSILRIPAPVDPMNWKPLTNEEKVILD